MSCTEVADAVVVSSSRSVVLLLVASGALKLGSLPAFRRTLAGGSLPRTVVPAMSVLVPLVEIGIGLVAVVGHWHIACVIAAVYLVSATTYLIVVRPGRDVGCGFFGPSGGVDVWVAVARNVLLTVAAVAGWLVEATAERPVEATLAAMCLALAIVFVDQGGKDLGHP